MAARVPILMYHKVAKLDPKTTLAGHYVDPNAFRRQMAALKALGYQSVSLNRLFEEPLPAKPVVLTFDDGYRNFMTHALPAMEKYGMNGTVFLVSNQFGGTNAWDVALGDVEERLMTHEEILDADRRGVEFGSHTCDHVHLDQVSSLVAQEQIEQSKTAIQEILGKPVSTFCYPYGGKNETVEKLVAAAGYRLACSTQKGANDETTNRYALRRANIRRDTVLPVFVLKLWRSLKNG